MSFTGNEDHRITLDEAKIMTEAYRSNMGASDKSGGFFSKSEILALLNQANCVGIRYYYGLDNNEQVLVLVGADANEDDLANGILLERAVPCPNQCGVNNDLNS